MNRISASSINSPIELLIFTYCFTIPENSFAFCDTCISAFVSRILLWTHDLTPGGFLCFHISALIILSFVLFCCGWNLCFAHTSRDFVTKSHSQPVSLILRSLYSQSVFFIFQSLYSVLSAFALRFNRKKQGLFQIFFF